MARDNLNWSLRTQCYTGLDTCVPIYVRDTRLRTLAHNIGNNDGRNPQYNLVFTPWDEQFDPDEREYYGFSPAGSDVEEQFERLRGRLDSTAQPAPSFDHPDYEPWRRKCIENLNKWTGIGMRL